MREDEIYAKEKKYLRNINILIIMNIFMALVLVVIFFHKPSTKSGRLAAGLMLPEFRIRPIKNIKEAKTRAMEYLDSVNIKELTLKRVISFGSYYYIYYKEVSTGKVAFALQITRLGMVTMKKFPSRFPQMMWNHKYGNQAERDKLHIKKMMMSMRTAMSIALDVTERLGASYRLTDNGDEYYGFFEFIVSKNKDLFGEISINGETGKVLFKAYPTPPVDFQEYL